MQDCIFCKIVNKEIPAEIVYETDDILAFKDIKPTAPIHALIIPKKHVLNLSEAVTTNRDLVTNVVVGIAEVAGRLGITDAYKATTNNGEGAGQVVPHLHFHLLGGWKNSGNVVSELDKI